MRTINHLVEAEPSLRPLVLSFTVCGLSSRTPRLRFFFPSLSCGLSSRSPPGMCGILDPIQQRARPLRGVFASRRQQSRQGPSNLHTTRCHGHERQPLQEDAQGSTYELIFEAWVGYGRARSCGTYSEALFSSRSCMQYRRQQ